MFILAPGLNCKFGYNNNVCLEGQHCFQVFESEYVCAPTCDEKWACFGAHKAKKDVDDLVQSEPLVTNLEDFLENDLNIKSNRSSTPLITREEFESAVIAG